VARESSQSRTKKKGFSARGTKSIGHSGTEGKFFNNKKGFVCGGGERFLSRGAPEGRLEYKGSQGASSPKISISGGKGVAGGSHFHKNTKKSPPQRKKGKSCTASQGKVTAKAKPLLRGKKGNSGSPIVGKAVSEREKTNSGKGKGGGRSMESDKAWVCHLKRDVIREEKDPLISTGG